MTPAKENAGKKKSEKSPVKEDVKAESGCEVSVAEEKSGGKIFVAVSALVVCVGIAVRIVMYTKCRSLWLDEALLAESIVSRSWGELLASPLSNEQSAPVLYVIAVKAICSVCGYSEFSLRVFSFFSFLGLLLCEAVFLKKVLKTDDIKTAFVLVITTFVPSYVYYSNELKPYMGDAFFVVLTLLLYAFYAQNRISLVKLTVCYALIFGFCTPAIFFIGGILTVEFWAAVFAKDKKHAIYVLISGLSVSALFGLYYYWWMLPISGVMGNLWSKSFDKYRFSAFSIVFVIVLYFLYALRSQKKPSLFFVGGISVGKFFAAIFAKSGKRVVLIFASILSIAAAFGLCYRAWPSFVSGALDNIKHIFAPSGNVNSKWVWVLVPFALSGIYSQVKQKNRLACSVVLSVLFACLAMSIGKWPPAGRLWLFLPAIILIFSAVGFDLISKIGDIVIQRAVFCLFSVIAVYYTVSCFGMFKDGVYRPNQEVNPLILYVKEHIKSDEKLYVYPPAASVLKFKNGYNVNKIGKTDKDNIIYGVSREEWNNAARGAEIDTIIKSRKAYLLFQHFWFGIDPGLAVLQKYGTITAVLDNYDTPLLYFEARAEGK